MSDHEVVDSSFTAIIDAPFEKIDLPQWAFTLPNHEYQGCSSQPASPPCIFGWCQSDACGHRSNVEVIGGSLMVQNYVGNLGEKHHLILESVSDIFTPNGRTTINVLWELSVKALDDQRCEFTNHVRSRATEAFGELLDKQGIPFEVFRAQRQPMSIAHNQGETPLFAASIERAAKRNWSPEASLLPGLEASHVTADLPQ
jgi:hypothetical protein